MRKSLIILGAVLAAPASAQSTDCRWLGSTWSCNTQPSVSAPSAPNDYLGAMGGNGQDYNETVLKQQQIQQNRNIIEMQEAQLRAMKRAEDEASRSTRATAPVVEAYHLEQKSIAGLDAVLELCPALARDPASVAESDRSVVQSLCYAYSKGRINGAAAKP